MPLESTRQTEARVVELEVKLSFMEDTLDRLNDVVVRQQQQLDLLMREVVRIRDLQASTPEAPAFRSLRDELPPHY